MFFDNGYFKEEEVYRRNNSKPFQKRENEKRVPCSAEHNY